MRPDGFRASLHLPVPESIRGKMAPGKRLMVRLVRGCGCRTVCGTEVSRVCILMKKTGWSNWGPRKTLMGCRLFYNLSNPHRKYICRRGGLAGGFYHQIVVILLVNQSFVLFLCYDKERM